MKGHFSTSAGWWFLITFNAKWCQDFSSHRLPLKVDPQIEKNDFEKKLTDSTPAYILINQLHLHMQWVTHKAKSIYK